MAPPKHHSKNETVANFATKAVIHQRVFKDSSLNETSEHGCGATETGPDDHRYEEAHDTVETKPAAPSPPVEADSPVATPLSPEIKFSLMLGQKQASDEAQTLMRMIE